MSTATSSPPSDPDDDQARPDLQVVRDSDLPEPIGEPAADEHNVENGDGAEPEPVLDSYGNPVTPQAPLDVRVRETVVRHLHGIPAFGQPPASFAEAIEYSQNGDWATSTNGAKRAAHGLATILAFLLTYPLVDLFGKARTKPGPFVIAVAIAISFLNVLAIAL